MSDGISVGGVLEGNDLRFIDISLVREPLDPHTTIRSVIAGGESLKYEAELEVKLRKKKPRNYRNRFEMLEIL